MRKDTDNPLALFSNKLYQGQTACEQELERLRADLDGEKGRTQRGFAHLSAELRRLREKAECEYQTAIKELADRRKCQTGRDSQRCSHKVAAGSAGSRSESAEREALCLRGGETDATLEQFLETLNKTIDGKRPGYKLHHRQGFELEKAIFLCHLLKAYRLLLQERRRAGCSSRGVQGFSRKQPYKDGISSCLKGPLQTYSRAVLQRPHGASHSPKKQGKRDQREGPVGEALHQAEPCLSATALDTCRSSALKICHPPNVPHAGWTTQTHRRTESPPPRCMEVGSLIFTNSTNDSKTNVSKCDMIMVGRSTESGCEIPTYPG